jgi:hypothetical protein
MPHDSTFPAAQVRAELDRIAASRWFRDSPRLQDFLRFAVEASLAGREGEVKETTVATEVFHRRAGFDPRNDSIVRVQATALRKKLTGYYEAEGAASPMRIELPRGHYVPVFLAGPIPVAPPRKPVWMMAAIAAAALSVAGACAIYIAHFHRPASALWSSFFAPGSKTIVVCGTPQFFGFDGLQIRDIDVNSEADLKPDSRILALYRSMSTSPAGVPSPSLTYTGIGEARSLELISHFFWERSQRPAVRLFPDVTPQERENANLVIIASLRLQSFLAELNLPADFVRVHAQGPGEIIRNMHPRQGEQREYLTSRNPANDASVEYAIVGLFPNRNRTRRILLIGGTTTYATEAAAQFVTEPATLGGLDAIVRGRLGSSAAYQCLLRVYQRGSSVARSELIAHHEWPALAGERKELAADQHR